MLVQGEVSGAPLIAGAQPHGPGSPQPSMLLLQTQVIKLVMVITLIYSSLHLVTRCSEVKSIEDVLNG